MKLTFLGANHEVTGSETLLEWVDGRYCLVDDGMEQGENVFENAPLPVPPARIEYVLVTHAHIDHTGNLPLLYRQGFRGKVYATRETCRLCAIMLADSAHIQASDAEYQSRKAQRAGKEAVEPAYTVEDVEALMKLFVPCEYGERVRVDEGFEIRFTDIGHLLGSAAIECWLTDGDCARKLVFSGDVGNTHQPIINDPRQVDGADFLVIESTYGDRLHEKVRQDPVPVLADVIQRTLDRGGNVVIPSFAVGRTQEMLYFIREIKQKGLVHGHEDFPVYVDSPLANEATEVFLKCDRACLDPEARAVLDAGENPIAFNGLHTVVTPDESKALNEEKTPKVILSASGMCDAGRIRHHLKYNLWRRECTVLFVGYQAAGTLGRALFDGAKSVRLFGDEIAVSCEIASLEGVSGHADRDGLLAWVAAFDRKPAQIFVNHGDDASSTAFAQTLAQTFGVTAEAPFSGSVYDLASGKWLVRTQGVPLRREEKHTPEERVSGPGSAGATDTPADAQAVARLREAVSRLNGRVAGAQTFTAREAQSLTDRIAQLLRDLDH